MEKNKATIWFALLGLLFLMASCAGTRERKSARYYYEHQKEIQSTLLLYKALYKIQPFNIGFSERNFEKIGIDIITDTVRYAVNNEQGNEYLLAALNGFHFDTTRIRRLYEKMYKMKSLWLGTDDFYYQGEKHDIRYLSFKSALMGNPFMDRKYFNLVFFEDNLIHPAMDTVIQKAGFVHIQGPVYYKIMDRFR